jgi:hypothetical protein
VNFRQQISNYILGNLTTSDLPKVALIGLEDGLDSESLIILAGLGENNNAFEINSYFNKVIDELGIQIPDKKTAALEIIRYYADLIKSKLIDPYLGVEKIVQEVFYKTDFFDDSKEYVYDCIGFERIYGLYDTCCELEAADRPWDRNKTNQELIEGFKKELIIEIEKWITSWK